jgi:hypothetical protein
MLGAARVAMDVGGFEGRAASFGTAGALARSVGKE